MVGQAEGGRPEGLPLSGGAAVISTCNLLFLRPAFRPRPILPNELTISGRQSNSTQDDLETGFKNRFWVPKGGPLSRESLESGVPASAQNESAGPGRTRPNATVVNVRGLKPPVLRRGGQADLIWQTSLGRTAIGGVAMGTVVVARAEKLGAEERARAAAGTRPRSRGHRHRRRARRTPLALSVVFNSRPRLLHDQPASQGPLKVFARETGRSSFGKGSLVSPGS